MVGGSVLGWPYSVLLSYSSIQISEEDKVGFRHHKSEGLGGGHLERGNQKITSM